MSSKLTFDQVVRHLNGTEPLPLDRIASAELAEPICGRITRGKSEADFAKLSFDHWKPLSWVVGSDAVQQFMQHQGQHEEMLKLLGFEKAWIHAKLARGEQFRLALFPLRDPATTFVATWDNVFAALPRLFPASVAAQVLAYEQALRTTPFAEIEAQAGYSYLEVDLAGKAHDKYMTVEKMEQLASAAAAAAAGGGAAAADGENATGATAAGAQLTHVRGFLYNQMGLSRLFDGAGRTVISEGVYGVSEYLTPNILVKDIPGFVYVDLNITAENVDRIFTV